MSKEELDGVWRTVRGRRIFIKKGESLGEAMSRSGKFSRVEKNEAKREARFDDRANKVLKEKPFSRKQVKEQQKHSSKYNVRDVNSYNKDSKNRINENAKVNENAKTRVERNKEKYSDTDKREIRREELQKKLFYERMDKNSGNEDWNGEAEVRKYAKETGKTYEQADKELRRDYRKYEDEKEKKIADYKAKKQSNNNVESQVSKDAKFDAMEFEKKIPKEMRWKETSSVNDGKDLYWITQEPFTQEMLNKYAEEFKNQNRYEKAYITTRDFSNYNYNDDLKKNTMAVIDRKGNISDSGYENQMNKSGWEYKTNNQIEESIESLSKLSRSELNEYDRGHKYKDSNVADYVRNKTLYQESGLQRHYDAMKEAEKRYKQEKIDKENARHPQYKGTDYEVKYASVEDAINDPNSAINKYIKEKEKIKSFKAKKQSNTLTRKQMAEALVDDQIKRGVVKQESREKQIQARLTGKFKMSYMELRDYYNEYLKKGK